MRTASKYGMAWVRHHDKYDGAVVDPTAAYQEPKNRIHAAIDTATSNGPAR